jgi:hypothetical protein
MSKALEVAAALGAAIPNYSNVADIGDDAFRDELAELEALSWPDFDVAMVGASPSVARPHGTEAEIANPSAAVVWTREGKLARVEFHMSRDEARRVAELD